MALSKSELVASLQNEVRLMLHLASKIDPAHLDYRPTPKQRSTIELLRYLTLMGPTLVNVAKGVVPDATAWAAADQAAQARNFEQTLEALAAHKDTYATLLADLSEADLSAELNMAGLTAKTTRGTFLVNRVLCQLAAYRMQLFLYLKACGREELNSWNLWEGIDAPVAV